jgi:hypothetical protein
MPVYDPYASPAIRPAPDSARFGVGPDVLLGVWASVRLEPDPQPDPPHHPTGQVSGPVSMRAAAATDPCLGVCQWGSTRYGGRL